MRGTGSCWLRFFINSTNSPKPAAPGWSWQPALSRGPLDALFGGAKSTIGFTPSFFNRNLGAQTVMTGALTLPHPSGLLVIVTVGHPFAGNDRVTPEALTAVMDAPGKKSVTITRGSEANGVEFRRPLSAGAHRRMPDPAPAASETSGGEKPAGSGWSTPSSISRPGGPRRCI